MGKTKTKDQLEELEVEETEELDEAEEAEETKPKGVRPKDLAEELDIDPKTLRGFLRREFPRSASAKNTSWLLTEAMVAAARKHFEESDDEVEDDESEEDED